MRHSQQATRTNMTCPSCKQNKCSDCIDVLRSKYSDKAACSCVRQAHGNPIEGKTDAVQPVS